MPEQTEPALIPGFKKCAGDFFLSRRALLGRGVTGGGGGGWGGGVYSGKGNYKTTSDRA